MGRENLFDSLSSVMRDELPVEKLQHSTLYNNAVTKSDSQIFKTRLHSHFACAVELRLVVN